MPRHDYASSPGGTLRNKLTGQCKGVTKSGSKYRAKVWCTELGKYKNLGTFDEEHNAAAAVAAAEARGTQYLPSPRQYVRRNNTLTYGALPLARTALSRPTAALTDSWFYCVRLLHCAAPTGNLPVQQRQQCQQQPQQRQVQLQQPLSPSSALSFVNAVFEAPLEQYTAPCALGRSSVLPVLARHGAAGPSSAASAARTVRARPLPASLRAARVAAAALR